MDVQDERELYVPNSPGRPSKLTPRNRRIFLDLMRRGATIRRACSIVGVHESTYQRWVTNDPQFQLDAEHAREVGVQNALDMMRRAGYDDWRAIESFLRMTRPEEFSPRQIIEQYKVTVYKETVERIIKVITERIPDPQLVQQVVLALEAHGESAA